MKKLIFALFLFILIAPLVRADGAVFPTGREIMEPEQKAVIYWNGETEKMILSTKIETDADVDLAWVVPINSLTPPEFKEADIQVFFLLNRYAPPHSRYEDFAFRTGIGANAAVEIVSHQKVGIYDVTVIKADDVDSLLDWLGANGFPAQESARPVLEKYVGDGHYFIANKISWSDINAYYKSAEDFLDEIVNWSYRPSYVTYDEAFRNNIACGFSGYGTTEQRFEELKNNLIYSVLYGIDYNNDSYANARILLNKEKYDELVSKYAVGEAKIIGNRAHNSAPVPVSCYYPVSEGVRRVNQWCEEIMTEKGFSSLDETEVYMNSIIERARSNYGKIEEELNNTMDRRWNTEIEKFVKFCSYFQEDASSLATPLEITFTPNEPFFPLAISSMNAGDTNITVFYIGESVVDGNNIMEKVREIDINDHMRSEISQYIPLGSDAKKLIRFEYTGPLQDLNRDAVFVQTFSPILLFLTVIVIVASFAAYYIAIRKKSLQTIA